jgi:hypothetical protein
MQTNRLRIASATEQFLINSQGGFYGRAEFRGGLFIKIRGLLYLMV